MPTSVGMAPTKTLAKLANHIAKTCDRQPGHYPAALSSRLAQVCHTAELTPEELDTLMAATNVGEVWGVGRKIAEQLQSAGVRSVLDLIRADVATLRRQFSVGLRKNRAGAAGHPLHGGWTRHQPPSSKSSCPAPSARRSRRWTASSRR